jgi:hypothetical protein
VTAEPSADQLEQVFVIWPVFFLAHSSVTLPIILPTICSTTIHPQPQLNGLWASKPP